MDRIKVRLYDKSINKMIYPSEIEEAYNLLNSKIDLDTNKLEEDKQ